MNIPNYQSQNAGPKTSGLDAANPGIVGGGPIVQGLGNAAQSMLVYAHYQQQQQQADQIDAAGKMINEVTTKLDAQRQTLKTRQDTQAINPRDLYTEYETFVSDTVKSSSNDPSIADKPYLKKYLDTHLGALAHSARQTFGAFTDATWQNWHEFQTLNNIDGFTRAAATAGAQGNFREQALQQSFIDQALMGAIHTKSMTAKEAREVSLKSDASVTNRKAVIIAESQARDLVDARHAGNADEFWKKRGIDSTLFDAELQEKLYHRSNDAVAMHAAEATKQTAADHIAIAQHYEVTKNAWIARGIPQNDAKGKPMIAEDPNVILSELRTKRNQNALGPSYDQVVTHYQGRAALKATGIKPSLEVYGKVALDIISGKLSTEAAVLNAAVTNHFDVEHFDKAMTKFSTTRAYFEGGAQHKIGEGVKVLNGTFDYPTSLLIDPAKAGIHRTAALTDFYLLAEHVQDTMTPQEAKHFDWVGRARAIADNEFERMSDGVIKILPSAEPSMSVEDAEKDLKAKNISPAQFNNVLQSHATYNRLLEITEAKKKRLAAQESDPRRKPLYK